MNGEVSVLTISELARFLRVVPRRIPAKVESLLRAVSGKPPYGFPPDDFDERTGLETASHVKIYKLDSVNGNYVHAQGYVPVPAKIVTQALQAIRADVKNHTFVDLGCGKGRALFVASTFGMQRIIGVEISPSLVRATLDNVARWKSGSDIQVVCADASEWEWPREDLVVFLYNPFDGVILSKVLENLHRSLCAKPRDVWIIYCSASHGRCFESQKWIEETGRVGPSILYHAAVS